MPLYIVEGDDHRQITTDDLAKLMGVEKNILKKLETNPVFEVRESLKKPDKINGGFRAPAGRMMKPVIFVKIDKSTNTRTDKPNGLVQEIRYATAIVADKINPRLSTYEPRRLVFLDMMDIVPNLEQALFKYLLPACGDSPIADKRNFHYTFQNKEKKAAEINDKGKMLVRALAYISNTEDNGGLSDHKIMLVAKGLYAMNRNPPIIPNPSAKNKTIEEVKADLITLSMKDPSLFLDSCDDDVNEFYGMVLDAVDRGIFEVRTGNRSKGWYWASGPNKGDHITDIGSGVNDFDALKGAIEANPNAFYATITRAVTEAAGRDNIGNFLKNKKADRELQAADDDDYDPNKEKGEITFVLPDNYNDSIKIAMTFNGGKSPSKAVCGKFWGAIKEKQVTAENVKDVIEKLIAEDVSG